MEQAHEPSHEPQIPVNVETSPSQGGEPGWFPPPLLVTIPDFAWQFSPCPTEQERDAFVGALKTQYPDVRSSACTKISTRPQGGLVEIERVGVWTSPPPQEPLASAARDRGLQELDFVTEIPLSGDTFAYFFNMVLLDTLIMKGWNGLCQGSHRLNSSGGCDPNGPIHLTGFSYSFQSADPLVVVTQIDGFDSDPETDYLPAADFHMTITDTVSASGGSTLQCQSTQHVQTNYPDWLAKLLALLALIVPVVFEAIALAIAGYIAFGGTIPGGNVPPVSGGVGCKIKNPPEAGGIFPDQIPTSTGQPLVTFNYTHVNMSAGGLFAGGSVNWSL